jgi:hypothetical protein
MTIIADDRWVVRQSSGFCIGGGSLTVDRLEGGAFYVEGHNSYDKDGGPSVPSASWRAW